MKEYLAREEERRLAAFIEDRILGAETEIVTINKVGGSYRGLKVTVPGRSVAPVINLDSFIFSREAVEDIISSLDRVSDEEINETIGSYEAARAALVLRVSPIQGNEEALNDVVWRPLADLALVPRIKFKLSGVNEGTAVIRKPMLKSWGISEDQLWEDAIASAPEVEPPSIMGALECILKKMGNPPLPDGMSTADDPMKIVTNPSGCCGASVLAYPKFDEKAREEMGGDYYILPSSIHEVILVPKSQMPVEDIAAMVAEINVTEVAPEDRLSDHVYAFVDGVLTVVG